ncbi:CRP/FNR family transcriptional regulator, anaerobic regulatory protein [Fodinibius salinus]|uniref:CRP/FNR family transcriptional regulator, anaerobic regulatory protein n=1 Tax=Fodinibius salinus TaxID=860790 RepID=A0A5D3YLM4_9BACT|nr:Crp/Fnr family transcriptional regulator [Fodinibius salinus]TYP94780.1 CRP/FNR family transcriptional regulator, anaerobic regulatory protein [Fodinibius salinus]
MKVPTDLSSLTDTLESDMDLSDLGITKQFAPGETIVAEDAPVRSIPIVTKGSIKVLQSDDTFKEMVLYYLRPGETCIMSFLAGLYHDTSKVKAVAEEESEVLFIPVVKIHNLIKGHPEWLNYIFQIYHKRFEELLEVVDAVAFKNMDERLLQFLEKRCEVMETDTLSMTHDQLAQELGTAREVISRLLKKMEAEGLVELGRNKIRLM